MLVPGRGDPIEITSPAWPSQALEGIWVLLGIPLLLVLERSAALSSRAGRGIGLLIALAWWLAGRAFIALTWRDERVVGPFGAEATATIVALELVLVALALISRDPPAAPGRRRNEPEGPGRTGTGGL